MMFNIVLVSCTEKSMQIIGAALPEPEIENNELFDANCVPGDVVLDSFYLNEATLRMLPDENTSRLVFKAASGETLTFNRKEEEPKYNREIVEKYCVNADREWSVGSEISEKLRISYEAALPAGNKLVIRGFMHKEKTWFTDKTKETGYYDAFQVYIAFSPAPSSPNQAHEQSTIRCTTWFDDSVVVIEDTELSYVDERLDTVTLNGQEFDNVLIGNDDPFGSEIKIYTQKDVGVIAFMSKTGELFVIE